MDESEFRRLLSLFPVVRSRFHCADDEGSSAMTSRAAESDELTQWKDEWSEVDKEKEDRDIDIDDPFWEKLRLAAARKVSSVEAKNFCKSFQKLHKKLVYETLSLDAAERILRSSGRLTG